MRLKIPSIYHTNYFDKIEEWSGLESLDISIRRESFMKSKLRIFPLLAVGLVLIIAVIFVWFEHNNKGDNSNNNSNNNSNIKETDSIDVTGGDATGKISDHVITWGVASSLQISEGALNAFNQELYARGYDFCVEFVPLSNANFYYNLAEYENKNGRLDICSVGFSALEDKEKALEFVKSGSFLPMDELLATEEGKKLVNLYDEKLWASVKVDGITYSVPNGWQKTVGGVYAFNKSYISEEELKDFHGDMAELEQYMEKVPKKDGFSHIIYANSDLNVEYQLPFDYRYGLVLPYDGEGAVNPYKEGPFYSFLNALHAYDKKGYINYDLSLKSSNYAKTSGAVAKMLKEGNFFAYMTIDLGLEASMDDMGSELLLYKTTPYAKSRVLGSTGILKDSKYQKEAFTLLTLAYTDETLANLLVYGVQGIDYELRDGKAYAIGGGETNDWINQCALGIFEMTYPNASESFQTDRLGDKKEYFKDQVKASPYISFNFYDPKFIETKNKIDQIVLDNLDLWKSDDMDVEYDRVNELLEKAGIDPLIDAVNKPWEQYRGLGD